MGLLQYRPKLSNQHTVFPFVRYGVLIGSFSRSESKNSIRQIDGRNAWFNGQEGLSGRKKNHRSVVSQS